MAQRWIAVVVLMVSAAACGGDGGGGGGSISTGLPPDQKLSALDDAEAKQACQGLSDGFSAIFTPNALLKEQCAATAIQASASSVNGEVTVDVQKCQQMSDACVANPPAGYSDAGAVAGDDDCSTASADAQLKSCDATVHEYEVCANAVVAELQHVLAGYTCTNWKTVVNTDENLDFSSLPECKTFQDECPDVPLMGD